VGRSCVCAGRPAGGRVSPVGHGTSVRLDGCLFAAAVPDLRCLRHLPQPPTGGVRHRPGEDHAPGGRPHMAQWSLCSVRSCGQRPEVVRSAIW